MNSGVTYINPLDDQHLEGSRNSSRPNKMSKRMYQTVAGRVITVPLEIEVQGDLDKAKNKIQKDGKDKGSKAAQRISFLDPGLNKLL